MPGTGRKRAGPPPAQRGRADILAALLALPDEPAGGEALEVDYDFLHLADSGDVLLICYGARRGRKDSGKGKGRAKDPEGADEDEERSRWTCDQRFVLRRRERDEEDR